MILNKLAAKKIPKGMLDHIGDYAGKAKNIAVGAAKGLKSGIPESTDDTIKKHLGLGGLKHIGEGYEAVGKVKGLEAKSKAFAHGLGKAAPSLAAGGLYLGAAKKVYDKSTEPDYKQQQYGY